MNTSLSYKAKARGNTVLLLDIATLLLQRILLLMHRQSSILVEKGISNKHTWWQREGEKQNPIICLSLLNQMMSSAIDLSQGVHTWFSSYKVPILGAASLSGTWHAYASIIGCRCGEAKEHINDFSLSLRQNMYYICIIDTSFDTGFGHWLEHWLLHQPSTCSLVTSLDTGLDSAEAQDMYFFSPLPHSSFSTIPMVGTL